NQCINNLLDTHNTYALNLELDEDTIKPTLLLNHVISIHDKRTAIIGVGRSLPALRELIQNYRIGEHGRVYLVDGKGKVQIHPSDTNIPPLRAYVGADLAKQLQGQEFSYGFHQRNGSALISASLPVPGIGWQIVAEIPTDELYADIRVATVQNIVLGIVAAIIALVIVTLLSGRILQPIRRVSSAMAAMAEQ